MYFYVYTDYSYCLVKNNNKIKCSQSNCTETL